MSSALFFFFFSSRRRHTRWTGDWSSDVCSSDLIRLLERRELDERRAVREGVRHLVRERQREPALPAAAGAGERNESDVRPRDEGGERPERLGAADQRVRRDRKRRARRTASGVHRERERGIAAHDAVTQGDERLVRRLAKLTPHRGLDQLEDL